MLLGVTGKPIKHSLSPALHRAALQSRGIKGTSLRLIADNPAEALCLAKQLGLRGLNVTAPFKEEMFRELKTSATPIAVRTAAVNSVCFDRFGNVTLADNTDVGGVKQSLAVALKDSLLPLKSALVLGAGGAARAAVCALEELQFNVMVANRTTARAGSVCAELGAELIEWAPMKLSQAFRRASVVISTIPETALETLVPLFVEKQLVLNAIYAARSAGDNSVEQALAGRGVIYIDGREWLLHQGLLAIQLFLEEDPALEGDLSLHGEILQSFAVNQSAAKSSIALVGMMGSGKTSVGAELSRMSGLPFLDLDRELERATGNSVASIFATHGESSFRALEREAVAQAASGPASVLACGGGVVLSSENVSILRKTAKLVWLWTDVETLSKRLASDLPNSRPLLAGANVDGADTIATLKSLLDSRLDRYAEAADLVIDASHRTPRQLAERIYEELH